MIFLCFPVRNAHISICIIWSIILIFIQFMID
ncbi:unnamed protein product [Schistosoma margrebowiei]|uniref:Uncharacterized protein n=1 Tax=Schistosoma margrebowiei TaxID=48269 RepID=A0A3P8F333_9TREM|nr:unnamed protein product [Schistosoma margrebowiei]